MLGKDCAILEDIVQYDFENMKKIVSYHVSNITNVRFEVFNRQWIIMMDVMAWQQQAMMVTYFTGAKTLSDICAVLNSSRRYHLPTATTLNYPICQNAISLLSKVLKELVKTIDGTGNAGNIHFFSHSRQPARRRKDFNKMHWCKNVSLRIQLSQNQCVIDPTPSFLTK